MAFAGDLLRGDLTQIRRSMDSNPSPFCAARGNQVVFSSSRQVLSGDAALNEGDGDGDGLVAEIATSSRRWAPARMIQDGSYALRLGSFDTEEQAAKL
jgi:hypothetical protein